MPFCEGMYRKGNNLRNLNHVQLDHMDNCFFLRNCDLLDHNRAHQCNLSSNQLLQNKSCMDIRMRSINFSKQRILQGNVKYILTDEEPQSYRCIFRHYLWLQEDKFLRIFHWWELILGQSRLNSYQDLNKFGTLLHILHIFPNDLYKILIDIFQHNMNLL